ncbi:DUF4928 domain-containing protein [Salmonella enterica subsp. enterica]|uniref:DUF4928 domain-containing protein n=1 Tax=Salmonella enterica subsp. enterica serovar Poona TaxID=436295 RepID=A0A5V6N745_SALET|nr:DUF4928 domain-containing protein [Salmonella enterica subsp. enterica serovar Give]EAN8675172.1 DUF4928 domain-containing protein [Salmonella enterica]EBS4765561.1 DUF4928 domain-containing protein [Salmonella enterica subsp. enterica serovar Poona]ECC9950775.1 DUF4928 domain-containing protein [Salmonella enterica subsp. enterica]ECN7370663.1 DUF4928 domain-containing protein [Salmonella enterica subsp. enterica serovar Muenchen]ECY3796496.1 DUF4928 domain-containing protein [Salmonella e
MDKFSQSKVFIEAAKSWYEGERAKNGSMNTNVMNAGLIVSQMVADGLPITDARLYSDGKSQVRGLSGPTISKILERHGETRTFTREGGRTSRGTIYLAAAFREVLNNTLIPEDIHIDTVFVSTQLEEFFTQCVRLDYFDKQRITINLDHTRPVSVVVGEIIKATAERSDKPTGVVLQHLIGAKLQLRFPDIEIGSDRANAADLQTDREGDFQIGTTAFHVTTAPMEKLISRCAENKRAGYRPIILTLESKVIAARQMADNVGMSDQISVQAAETFIGNNIEEIAIYDGDKIREGLARLIRTYNARINAIEVDKSLMIDEPRWITNILGEFEFKD